MVIQSIKVIPVGSNTNHGNSAHDTMESVTPSEENRSLNFSPEGIAARPKKKLHEEEKKSEN